ncbi:MAG: thiosulfate oxidation carrier protein SoxY [Burkholderiales bacterium]|nr:thiosulfate oxidation carrier protein SoxY [Burkholderiales bacterium]
MQRRDFVLGAAAAAGWLPARAADAPGWNRNAFSARTFADVVKALGGGVAQESKDVAFLQAPEIAENGTSVRFAAESRVPGTTQVAFVVEKNPFPLAALFDVPAGTDPSFTLHLKMGESSRVYALARAGDRWLYAVRNVTVTLGGCAA